MTEGRRALRDGVEVPVIDTFDGEYAFLSNFYSSEIRLLEGSMPVLYPTVEHAYQASKTLDLGKRQWIRSASSPGQAKIRGREVEMRANWNDMRVPVMKSLLIMKFGDDPLKQMLLDTGDAELIEGNTWHDVFWGDCRCDWHRGQGGLNHLGRVLMEVREALQKKT